MRGTASRNSPTFSGLPALFCAKIAGNPQKSKSSKGNNVHVVIMGCGRVGATLATALEQRGHSVAVIDQEESAFRRLSTEFTGETVTGNGFDRAVLIAAGIEHADAFAAVSNGDNSNIISARVARENFDVHKVVARIYDPGRAEVYERLGIPTVATARWTAKRILGELSPDEDREVWRDPTSSVAILEAPIHPGWIGRRISSLEDAIGVRVAYLTRFGLATLPTPSLVVQEGDQIFVLTTDELTGHIMTTSGSAPSGGEASDGGAG